MNYNFVPKALFPLFIIYFNFYSLIRRIQSNDILVNNTNNFRDGSQNFSDKWPKLFRKRESSYYFHSQKDLLESRIKLRKLGSIEGVSNRRGTVGSKGEVTFMSSLKSPNDAFSLSVNQRKNKNSKRIGEDPVNPNGSGEKLEMDDPNDSILLRLRTRSAEITEKIVMKNCGISKGLGQRIVNGRDAEEGTYPWIVAILKFGDAWCGGTIINEWWIITASHCFMGLQDPFAYVARVGTINRNIGPTYKIKKLIMHERFHLDNMFNSDIALLKVDRPIKMGDYVNGICLPKLKLEEPKAASLIVVGWGATKYKNKDLPVNLQEISLKRISDGQCAKKYKEKSNTIYRSQLCTWSFNKDACQGDSGGPAIEIRNGRAILVGIVSYGSKCADEFPGVFTQVSYFIDWIVKTINDNNN